MVVELFASVEDGTEDPPLPLRAETLRFRFGFIRGRDLELLLVGMPHDETCGVASSSTRLCSASSHHDRISLREARLELQRATGVYPAQPHRGTRSICDWVRAYPEMTRDWRWFKGFCPLLPA
jgi:hypothetical protein